MTIYLSYWVTRKSPKEWINTSRNVSKVSRNLNSTRSPCLAEVEPKKIGKWAQSSLLTENISLYSLKSCVKSGWRAGYTMWKKQWEKPWSASLWALIRGLRKKTPKAWNGWTNGWLRGRDRFWSPPVRSSTPLKVSTRSIRSTTPRSLIKREPGRWLEMRNVISSRCWPVWCVRLLPKWTVPRWSLWLPSWSIPEILWNNSIRPVWVPIRSTGWNSWDSTSSLRASLTTAISNISTPISSLMDLSIREITGDWSLLGLRTDVTWRWLLLWCSRREGLPRDPQVLVRLRRWRILVKRWLSLSWCSIVPMDLTISTWDVCSRDLCKPAVGAVSMSSTVLNSKCSQWWPNKCTRSTTPWNNTMWKRALVSLLKERWSRLKNKWLFSSLWTLAMRDVRNYRIT